MAVICSAMNVERLLALRSLPWRCVHANQMLRCVAGTDSDPHRKNYSGCTTRHPNCLLQIPRGNCVDYRPQRRHFYIHQVAVDVVKIGLLELHSFTGLEWWAAIVLVAVPLRVSMSVLVQYLSRRNTLKTIAVQKACAQYGKQLAKEMSQSRQKLKEINVTTKDQYDYLFTKKMKEFEKKAYMEAKTHPRKMFLYNFIPLPLWLAVSLALRSMSGGGVWKYISESSCPSMATEGCLWFPDLLAADPFHILPIATCALFMLSFEIGSLTPVPDNHPYKRLFRVLEIAGRTWTCVMLYLFWNLPSAITWYWTLSAGSATCMNIALRSSGVRAVCGVPSLPNDSATPYTDMLSQARKRYRIDRLMGVSDKELSNISDKDNSTSCSQDTSDKHNQHPKS